MQQATVDHIRKLPDYQRLVRARRKLAWQLSAIMLIAYYGFILLLAFKPEFFTIVVWGEYVTIGFPLGVGLIVLAFVLTGIYVRRANNEFDVLTENIRREVRP